MTAKSQPAELDRLLSAAIDGGLSEVDEADLAKLLDDPAARRRYLHYMQLHAELHWNHGAQAALLANADPLHSGTTDQYPRPQNTNRKRLLWAVVLTTLAAGVLLPVVRFVTNGSGNAVYSPPAIATIESPQGSVGFRDSSGKLIEIGDRQLPLPAGTLIVEGESSAVQWRFLDGTMITVTGDAEINISDASQKLLQVKQGTLIAEVQPQPRGRPLIIETATARVDVLGTVFTLAAQPEQTRINVAEGRVRMKRLVDGDTIEVPEEHACVASLDARDKLQPQLPDDLEIGWSYPLTEPPPKSWKGVWLPPEGELPARVRAVACLMGRGRESERKPIVHYGISARRGDDVNLGVLPNEAILRLRFRTLEPARLQILLGLHRADGGFGGNFEVKLPRGEGTLREDGWREVKIPLDQLQPLVEKKPVMPQRAKPYLLLITTLNDDAGLEVAELAIENATP